MYGHIYIYFIFYIHTPIHYIASTAGFGIHLSIYYLSGYRIGFTKDEGVTGKDDFLTRQNTTDFQLNGMVGGPKSIFKLLWLGVEHIGILNMHQKWFQSFLKVSGVPSFSLVFFSSVHPKSPDNFANRTSVFIVLPLWNVGSTPFPPENHLGKKSGHPYHKERLRKRRTFQDGALLALQGQAWP